MSECIHTFVWGVHRGHKRTSGPLKVELHKVWATWHGCWKSNSSPLQEQQALLPLGYLSRPTLFMYFFIFFFTFVLFIGVCVRVCTPYKITNNAWESLAVILPGTMKKWDLFRILYPSLLVGFLQQIGSMLIKGHIITCKWLYKTCDFT